MCYAWLIREGEHPKGLTTRLLTLFLGMIWMPMPPTVPADRQRMAKAFMWAVDELDATVTAERSGGGLGAL
ncbi:hypothetical protein GA0115256_115925 [Streptomyces sp. DconLS]|nr:hypothetical protein GA0115256_115925 [Streptomyces sp. DconLS]SCG06680.1 hypothetical protein GA0115258_1333128 [Streptomyces sp. LamerLS-31b]